jgi:hypothetical protein
MHWYRDLGLEELQQHRQQDDASTQAGHCGERRSGACGQGDDDYFPGFHGPRLWEVDTGYIQVDDTRIDHGG